MQRIEVDSLVIHDTTQEVNDVGYGVQDPIKGIDLPNVRITQYPKAGAHGIMVPQSFWGGRLISFNGYFAATNAADFETKYKNLQSVLTIDHNSEGELIPHTLRFVTDTGATIVQISAHLTDASSIDQTTVASGQFHLEWLCDETFLQSGTLKTQIIQLASNGGAIYAVTYPVIYGATTGGKAIITNAGTGDAAPTITLDGPLTNPRVFNATTGDFISFTHTLALNDQIVIDMANGTVVQNGSINQISKVNPGSTFWDLVPGPNDIRFTSFGGSDSGFCTVTWRDAYIGV